MTQETLRGSKSQACPLGSMLLSLPTLFSLSSTGYFLCPVPHLLSLSPPLSFPLRPFPPFLPLRHTHTDMKRLLVTTAAAASHGGAELCTWRPELNSDTVSGFANRPSSLPIGRVCRRPRVPSPPWPLDVSRKHRARLCFRPDLLPASWALTLRASVTCLETARCSDPRPQEASRGSGRPLVDDKKSFLSPGGCVPSD